MAIRMKLLLPLRFIVCIRLLMVLVRRGLIVFVRCLVPHRLQAVVRILSIVPSPSSDISH